MSPVPGQRAAQRPLRAMTAAQRVVGRAVQASAGAMTGPVGVGFIDGRQVQIDLAAPPGEQVREVLACGCVGACTCPAAEKISADGGTQTPERQE
ncbi:hypothetical protein ACIQZO_06055 [Streptomyces sp. NPDC097617]|uniref:hypothetical protein n=1 Tax=Streptomyces sp. NPDC097617 TaxID=3366091 RepID=UPI0037F74E45